MTSVLPTAPGGLVEEAQRFVYSLGAWTLPAETAERFQFLVGVQARLHAAGLAVVAWPKEHGGRGLSFVDALVVSRALGQAGAPETINFVALDVVAPGLMKYATPEQLLEWLPPMAPAAVVWCQLFSEPEAGSDLAALRTRAIPRGTDWVLNGQKLWCSWGQFAQKGLLLARTGAADSRHRGLTAFVLDMDMPGISIRPVRTMTGSEEFCEVFLEDVVVTKEALVGEPELGWSVAMEMLTRERSTYAVRRSTVIRSALKGLHEMVRTEGATRRVREAVIDATIAMELLDLRIADVMQELASGREPGADAGLTKMFLTRAEQTVFSACADALGTGLVATVGQPHEWQESYLFSRACSIYGGSEQIQRNVLGERVLGLPRGM